MFQIGEYNQAFYRRHLVVKVPPFDAALIHCSSQKGLLWIISTMRMQICSSSFGSIELNDSCGLAVLHYDSQL